MPSSAWKKRLNSSHLVISYAVFCLEHPSKLPSTLSTSTLYLHIGISLCSEFVFFCFCFFFFFFNDTATTEIYTLSLHDALPILERIYVDGPRLDEHLLTAI